MTAAWDSPLRTLQAAQRANDAVPEWIEPPRPEVVLQVAASEFGESIADITGRSKARRLTEPRAFVVWALRSLGEPMSYPAIGRVLGGRDHSPVVHLHQRAIDLRLRDRAFGDACRRFAYRIRTENHHGQ